VKVSTLPAIEPAHRLKQGTNLRIGPFVTRIQSSIPNVIEGIRLLYADYPQEGDDAFVDFHVRLAPPRSPRRWFRPQVLFFFDGSVPFKPLPLDQAFPLFEWGLNWCVAKHINQYLILHAGVIEKGGHAVIMAAPPGSGKSTLCAGLVARGWRLLSDELALVSPEDGRLIPLPRPVSLKNDSIDVIRSFAPEVTIGRESADTTKGTVAHMKAPDDSIARADEHARPAWVICPKYEKGVPARLERRSRAQIFMHVIKNAFNYSVLGVRGFQTAAALIDVCDCYDFTYSSLDEAIDVFDALEPGQNR
jgi:HprK-related kinase A